MNCIGRRWWLVIAVIGILAAFAPARRYAATRHQVTPVRGYQFWTRVNAKPERMSRSTVQSCLKQLPLTPLPTPRPARTHSPHLPFYNVYVNGIGAPLMPALKGAKFPEGSVIVKEKVPSAASREPELLTVMIKRAPGYNPSHGDWEFMVTNGSASKIEDHGKLNNCQGCHDTVVDNDYVFGGYRTADW